MPATVQETPELSISPTIMTEGWDGELIVRGEYLHTRFLPSTTYSVSLTSTFFYATVPRRKSPITVSAVSDSNGELHIPFVPDISGEWILKIESEHDGRKHLPVTIACYVLPRELSGFRLYMGELHAHSTGSDGTQQPAYPPMRARTFGYDFFALTDHWNYQSSVEMIRTVGTNLGSRMLLLRGEEMHPERELLQMPPDEQPHGHHYHYTAIGHTESVRDAFLQGGETVRQEVSDIAEELAARGVQKTVDLLPYAEGVWKIRKAREFGGIVLFAHPYWATPVNLDAGAIEQTFRDREYDAVEVLSRADSSSFMPNRWYRTAAEGSPDPAVGVSDSHSSAESVEPSCFTMVLANRLDRESVLEAVRHGRCVACRPDDPPTLVGPPELVDLATFYLAHVLPRRRRITSLQGDIALSGLRGGACSQEMIDALDADLDAFDVSIWSD